MTSTSPDRQPLLKPVMVPPMASLARIEQLSSPVEVPSDSYFPPPTVTTAKLDAQKRRLPQCIAHRGYRARYPENSLSAFKAAVKVGAHAIETDLHLTKDNVVVISHDPTLKRCFGRPEKIIDCTWSELKDLRTVMAPHEPMPRLVDLLAYLSQPGLEEIWLLLDIKIDDSPSDMMRLIASTLASYPPLPGQRPWSERIVLGIWAAKYLPLALEYLPGYPVMHIGFSLFYARHFFTVPDVGLSMMLPILLGPGGKKFLRDAREVYKRKVLAWTVNEADKMEWCIRRKLDGVITDQPEKYLEVCRNFDESKAESWLPISFWGILHAIKVWFYVTIVTMFLMKRIGPVASQDMIKRGGAGQ